jgi:hypothetical protein
LITLAAWNDSVWGGSDFGLGDSNWNLQGSFDEGTTWGEFQTQTDQGTMNFALDRLDLTPGASVSSTVHLRDQYNEVASSTVLRRRPSSPTPERVHVACLKSFT